MTTDRYRDPNLATDEPNLATDEPNGSTTCSTA